MKGEDGGAESGGRSLKLVFRLAGLVFVALCLGFFVHLLVEDWPEASVALRHATLWWLVPAAVCAVGGMFILAWRWGGAIVAVGGEPAGLHRLVSAFFVGEAGKYIPGAVWAMLGRSELARREGYERAIAYSSVALSVIGCYLAAALTALVLAVISLIGGGLDMPWWPVVLVAVIGATAIHPSVSSRLVALASRLLGRTMTIEIPSWTRCLRLTGTYIPVWILIGAATTLVTKSLVANPPIARVALAAVVSWIIGFITPSPGGIGVREAVFVAIAGVAAGPAAAAAILARVLFVLVDGSGAAVGWLILRGTEPTFAFEATRKPANLSVESVNRGSGGDVGVAAGEVGGAREGAARKPATISMIVPALNEAENLVETIPQAISVLEKMDVDYEVLVIDDGSTDGTPQVMRQLRVEYPHLRSVRLRRNAGKAAALSIGFDLAQNDVFVMMDADGQDEPSEIPALIAKLDEGFDLVTGRRATRHDRFLKRHTSQLYNATTAWVSGVPGRDFNSGLKVLRREVAESVDIYGELHRYLPVLADWAGFSVTEVEVEHHSRLHGKTKYGIARFWRGLFDLGTVKFITSYNRRPFHLFGGVGLLSAFIGTALLIWMFIRHVMGLPVGNHPALITGVLFEVVAVQLLSFGLIGELLVYLITTRGHGSPLPPSEVSEP